MKAVVVVENPGRWKLDVRDIDVTAAREYLTDPSWSERRGLTVFNLCRNYGYQRTGYYVSLLAAARGHRPLPSVATIQDLKMTPLMRILSEDLDGLIQRALAPLKSERFDLSIYFGRNVTERYDRLARALYNQYPAPFLRASFLFEGTWRLERIRAIATSEIPDTHREFAVDQVRRHLAGDRRPSRPRREYRYDLAILADPEEPEPPSDERAIQKFIRAAHEVGIGAMRIDKDDYGRVAEFDALFIRETTNVDHHTFRFSRRAAVQGLVVIDDPESIVRCTNKVYQAELFARCGVATPRTLLVHAGNAGEVEEHVGLPCILKRPDSAFSRGVSKASTPEELAGILEAFLAESDLVLAQEYVPSAFDWRIGVLDGKPLYACRYHMAKGHWQIIGRDTRGRPKYGRVEALSLDEVPQRAVRLAVRAARPIGDGLYGVDIKQAGSRFVVIEINDNPTIETGMEDAVVGDGLYLEVMRVFRDRLDRRGNAGARS